jgi:repressor LexA
MPTDRSRQVLDFVRAYVARHGYAPKLREIASHLGIRSRGVVHRYLRALEDEGLIAIEPDVARGVRVRGRGQARTGHTLPLLGRIAAGRPIEAIADQSEVDLAGFFVNANRFVLKVTGDSMVEDGILDGDMVIVEKRDTADNGEIVVALIDNEEATLKRLQTNRDGSVTLKPANSHLAPMRYAASRVRIQGVVVGQFRAYR